MRDPEKAGAFTAQGVRVRRGDFDDPESLAKAFEGVSQVLVISTDTTGETTVRLHTQAIEAARKAGARRILYTSHTGARPDSPFPTMPRPRRRCTGAVWPSPRCTTASTPPMRCA